MLFQIIVAVVAAGVFIRIGVFALRALAAPVPELQQGELRRVNFKFQCTICGAEVRMTKAGEELPPAPRHCLEDMQLVSPIE